MTLFQDQGPVENLKLKRARGCKRCRQSGYDGRSGIHEILRMTDQLKSCSFGGDAPEKLAEVARQDGFRTLREDGLDKVLLGETTLEEIARLTGAQ